MKWLNIIAPEHHTLVSGHRYMAMADPCNTERTRIFANGQTGVDASLGNVSQFSAGLFAEDDWTINDGISP